MIVNIKRIIKKNKLLFFIFFIITLVIYIGLNNVMGCYMNLQERTSSFPEDTVNFFVDGAVNDISMTDVVDSLVDEQAFITFDIKQQIDEKYSVSPIFLGNASQVKFDINKGRNFSVDDYEKHRYTMVIKDTVYESLKIDNLLLVDDGKEYVDYCEKKYEVIGTYDSSIDKCLNDIYINIYTVIDNSKLIDNIASYQFMYNCGEDTKNKLNKMSNKYNDIQISITDLIRGRNPMSYSLESNRLYVIAMILIIVISFITITNISSYWIQKKTKEIAVRKLVGAHNISLVRMTMNTYLTVCILGMFLGSVVFEILKKVGVLKIFILYETDFSDDLRIFLVALIIIFIFSLIILIKPTVKVCKLQINEVIRGED